MSVSEIGLFAGLIINTLGLAIVLFKLVWGGATSQHIHLTTIRDSCNDSISASENRLLVKIEAQSTNIGNVVANIGDRIHQLELKAMETRAVAAETYMRRDSYHKATDEFKRDVREAHLDLKKEMHAGFDELKDQINSVSMSIEAGRKENR